MSEAAEGGGRSGGERRLIQRSLEGKDFRHRLLENPRLVVEEELGTRLPGGVEVRAVEETAETIYLVLPSAGASPGEGGELSDETLESVAGGWSEEDAWRLVKMVTQVPDGPRCP